MPEWAFDWANLGALPLFIVNGWLWWRVERRVLKLELLLLARGIIERGPP